MYHAYDMSIQLTATYTKAAAEISPVIDYRDYNSFYHQDNSKFLNTTVHYTKHEFGIKKTMQYYLLR